MDGTMVSYEHGYVYVDNDVCRIDKDGTITVGGYGMIHESLRKEILNEYLNNFWTKDLKNDYKLLIVRDDAWLVKGYKIEEASWKKLSRLMDPSEEEELPML